MEEPTVLVLRTCNATMTSYGGFVWPRYGPVEAPDWDPTPHCGNGLHGLLFGVGDSNMLDWAEDAVWMVVQVRVADIVDLGNAVKFRRGNVIYAGDQAIATRIIYDYHPGPVHGVCIVVGDGKKAMTGDHGRATAGAGGIATGGQCSIAIVGNGGKASVGFDGTARAGDGGHAVAGERGRAYAGHGGSATVGNYGIAHVGIGGTARAGIGGTARAGIGGTIMIQDETGSWITGIVGENGIRPHVLYRGSNGQLVAV